MRKLTCTILLLTLTFSLIACYNQVYPAQAATFPPSIISSDTIWTQEGSPYNLSGPILVSAGVSLTIQAGATVNLNAYYLQVNGTLQIRGTSSNPVRINSPRANSGQIKYTASATSWNEQTGTGCTIENAVINQTVIYTDNCAVKITGNTFNDEAGMMSENIAISTSGSASSTITNNVFYLSGLIIRDNSIVSANSIGGGMGLYGGSPTVSGNTITGSSSYFYMGRDWDRDYNTIAIHQSSPTLSGNTIMGSIVGGGNDIKIIGNTIQSTVSVDGSGTILVSNNLITGDVWASNAETITITGNLIVNATDGVHTDDATVKDNTIANCQVGILLDAATSPNISGNNILNCTQHSVALTSTSKDINLSGNYWGTTDTQTITQSIYDKKNDFNLGSVTITPILNAPNPSAPSIDSLNPTPAETSTTTSTTSTSPASTTNTTPAATNSEFPQSTPVAPEFPAALMLIFLVLAVPLAVIMTKRQRKRT